MPIPAISQGTPVVPQNTTTGGASAAAGAAEITPSADAFVCHTGVVDVAAYVGGFRVLITTAGIIGDLLGTQDGTLVGTLKVQDEDGVTDYSDPMPVCDWSDPNNNQNPAVGTLLRLKSNSLSGVSIPAGHEARLIWNETGDTGTGGARPKFRFVGWQLPAVRDEAL